MLTSNKRMKSAKYVSQFESIFKCPICDTAMSVYKSKSLICVNKHTFDFTKQGYLNLMSHPVRTKYGQELFEARRKLIEETRFFAPLIEAVVKIIQEHIILKKGTISFLDTGCGEGSHLVNICDRVRFENHSSVLGVGIDLAKEGILVASKNYADRIWSVADLANTPFRDQQFDVILNILSPSNYAEFNRLLKMDGLVIKVVPQSGYLKELREILFDEPEKQTYSNADTVERFNENFDIVETTSVGYTINLKQPYIQYLVQMTPLTWAISEEKLKSFFKKDSAQITVDLDILIGKNQ